MAISRILRSRIETDAKAPDYWYVPHGQSIRAENWDRIADHLKVLAEFQTVPWEEAQQFYVKRLLKQKLIEPYKNYAKGFSAVGRMQFPVWRLLGLAWVNKGAPEITDVGRRFVESKSKDRRQALLEMQLHRYQFYNPSVGRHFINFRTFPILGLYRLLSGTDWQLTWEEFLLFGTRIRTFSDADELAELVHEWRTLTRTEREQLIAVAKTIQAASHTKSKEGTTWQKLQNDLNYIQAALSVLTTLNETDKGIEVPQSARRKVHRIVLDSAGSAEVIDYQSEPDWLAIYGRELKEKRQSTPWANASDAREYYERVGRIDAATAAYAKEDKGRTENAIEQYRRIQVLERVLEDVLEHNLDALETGLTLLGRQYPTAVGPIDLLAQDKKGVYVIIELKRGRGSDRIVGQIARYITWVVQRLGRGKESSVRGIIVGSDFDKHFGAAISQLKQVAPYTFDLRILCEPWVSKQTKSRK